MCAVLLLLRPQPPCVLYGTDAAVYAQVAQEMAARPIRQAVAVQLDGAPFYEHPPGAMALLALLAWARAPMAARVTPCLAQAAAQGAAAVVLATTWATACRLGGPWAGPGALALLLLLPGFVHTAANPMLEIFVLAGLGLATWAALPARPLAGARALLAAGGALWAFWCKGPVALLAPWSWLVLARLGFLSARRLALLSALTAAGWLASVWTFERQRAALGLPSFFARYLTQQLWPSMRVGRHHPEQNPLYYLPVLTRWYALGHLVALGVALGLAVRRRRHRGRGCSALFCLGLAWWGATLLAFGCMRQKYAWYVHLIAPALAWMGAALPPTAPALRRALAAVGWVGAATVLAVLVCAPAKLTTRRPLLDALYAVPPAAAERLQGRNVCLAGYRPSWREYYTALFLWGAHWQPQASGDAPQQDCVALAPLGIGPP